MLFAIFNSKGLGNFKVRPNHTILKGMDADKSKVFSSINAMKFVTHNYQKKLLFQEIPAPKKVLFMKKQLLRIRTALKKYIL